MRWETRPLAEIVDAPISGEWGTGEGNTKVLRTTNFTNSGALDFTNVVEREIDARKVAKKRLLLGDVIIEKSGGSPKQPVGRVVYFDVPSDTYLCNNFTSVLRPKPLVAPRYLFWYLFSLHQSGTTLKYQNKTTGILNLKLERYLKETNIPLPPLDVQRQISDTLDKADALRRKDQQLSQKYDVLAQSIFYDMFGDPFKNDRDWSIIPLANLIEGDLQNGLYKPSSAYGTGAPILRIDSFYNGTVTGIDALKRLTITTGEISKYGLQEDDIVINRVNSRPYLGKCGLIPPLKEPTVFESNMMRFRVKKSLINPFYLVRILSHDFVRKQIMNRCKDAVNQSSINQQDVLSFVVPIPPVELQNRFREVISTVLKGKDKVLDGHEASDRLFQSLMQNYFSN